MLPSVSTIESIVRATVRRQALLDSSFPRTMA
jgi:hypothetical protein